MYVFGNMGKKLNVHTRITSLSSRVIFPFSHSLWNIPDEKNKDFSYVINPKHNTQEYVAQEHERIEQKLSIQFLSSTLESYSLAMQFKRMTRHMKPSREICSVAPPYRTNMRFRMSSFRCRPRVQ